MDAAPLPTLTIQVLVAYFFSMPRDWSKDGEQRRFLRVFRNLKTTVLPDIASMLTHFQNNLDGKQYHSMRKTYGEDKYEPEQLAEATEALRSTRPEIVEQIATFCRKNTNTITKMEHFLTATYATFQYTPFPFRHAIPISFDELILYFRWLPCDYRSDFCAKLESVEESKYIAEILQTYLEHRRNKDFDEMEEMCEDFCEDDQFTSAMTAFAHKHPYVVDDILVFLSNFRDVHTTKQLGHNFDIDE